MPSFAHLIAATDMGAGESESAVQQAQAMDTGTFTPSLAVIHKRSELYFDAS